METPKEKAIKAAYGEHWDKVKDYVDEDGWCTHPDKNEMFPETDDLDSGYVSLLENTDKWMPTHLDRIIDNNGWTRIESEEDLPKDKTIDVIINDECYQGYIYEGQGGLFCCVENRYNSTEIAEIIEASYVTHYQPIETSKPPIF